MYDARMPAEVDRLPASSRDFVLYARRMSARNAQLVGAVSIVCTLLFWPLDHVFFRDPAIPAAFVQWRLIVLAVVPIGMFALARVGPTSRWVVPIVGTVTAMIAVALGRSLPRADGFFQGIYIAPFGTVLILTPLRSRIAWVATASFLYLGSYFASAPESFELAKVLSSSLLFLVASGISTVVGHLLYRQFETIHRQRLALDERARRLEELDALKNDLFANVSHELRTPLTLILGHLRGLARDLAGTAPDGSRERVARDRITTAERTAARVLVLIEELLELARFTSGRAEPQKHTFDLARLVVDVASNFRPSTPDEGALAVHVPPSLPVEADPRQIRTALHNLLSNACKFTEPGTRRVVVEVEERGGEARISVQDNGIGIPEQHLPRIFERFYRVERGYTRAHAGTGVGLALVREVIVAHGGEVTAESRVGEGSRFTIVLPIGAPSRDVPGDGGLTEDERALAELHDLAARRPSTPELAAATTRATTVLSAEDDVDLSRYLAAVLSRAHGVEVVHDGASAIARAEALLPDAVVTDLMMRGTSGLEVAKALRGSERTARTPSLFLTARAGTDARAEAYEYGADDFLTKPLDEDELLARVANLISIRRAERELAAANEGLEARVRERTERLQELARHQEATSEEERRRLARELHDEAGQLLMALRMELDLTRDHPAAGELGEHLDRMGHVLDQVFDATRALVAELRPRILDDFGLGAAAEWYLDRFAERGTLECGWRIEPPDLTADPASSTAVYRVLQEALTNVVRHSGASRVDVKLLKTDEAIELEVADDGKGVTAEALESARGFGLLGMRERAYALAGEVSITAAEPHGTVLRLRVPARAA